MDSNNNDFPHFKTIYLIGKALFFLIFISEKWGGNALISKRTMTAGLKWNCLDSKSGHSSHTKKIVVFIFSKSVWWLLTSCSSNCKHSPHGKDICKHGLRRVESALLAGCHRGGYEAVPNTSLSLMINLWTIQLYNFFKDF